MGAEVVKLIRVMSRAKMKPFQLMEELNTGLEANGLQLADGDVLPISGKYLAMA